MSKRWFVKLKMVKNRATKGINIPEPFSNLPSIRQDRKDLEFAADIGVDFIFASFIRSRKMS